MNPRLLVYVNRMHWDHRLLVYIDWMHLDCQKPLFINQWGYKPIIFFIPRTLTLTAPNNYEKEWKEPICSHMTITITNFNAPKCNSFIRLPSSYCCANCKDLLLLYLVSFEFNFSLVISVGYVLCNRTCKHFFVMLESWNHHSQVPSHSNPFTLNIISFIKFFYVIVELNVVL